MNSPSKLVPEGWLRPFLQPLKPTFREVLTMTAFVNILALAGPVFSMQVYDRVIGHSGISTLYGLVIGMLFVIAFDYILRQSRTRIMQTVALRVDVVVGKQLFNKVMSMPLQALEARPGAYWQTLFRDVDVVRNMLSGGSAMLAADLPFAVLFLVLIVVIAAPVAWVLLIILPLFMFIAFRAGAAMSEAGRMELKSSQSRDGLIAEIIAGRTTIKALALDRAMGPIWEHRHAENIESSLLRGSKADGYANLGASITVLTTVLMTTVGALAIINQDMTMGQLIAANMLSGRLMGPLNQLVNTWRGFNGFIQSVERLGEAFAAESERSESEVQLGNPTGDITVENVSFSYAPGMPPVVDRMSIRFPPGGVHALVGRNGSGKTTLVKLVQGLYKPTEGRVLLDGADISQFTRRELAEWIGYVPQESLLFEGTIRDNIAHRCPDASDDEIIRAATAAGVHHFIIDLADGYGSDIGEAGRRLSGGQRQRIAIARALVGKPPVLILDEPSSSLDRHAEIELRETITALAKQHTVIVVTHSPILLAACDNLVALDRGKVALAGPADEILPRLLGGTGRVRQGRPAEALPAPAKGAPPLKEIAAPMPAKAGTAQPNKPTASNSGDTSARTPVAAPPPGTTNVGTPAVNPAATPSGTASSVPPTAANAGNKAPAPASGVATAQRPAPPTSSAPTNTARTKKPEPALAGAGASEGGGGRKPPMQVQVQRTPASSAAERSDSAPVAGTKEANR
jgi:ATP-binding cassette subfamily C protein LapB